MPITPRKAFRSQPNRACRMRAINYTISSEVFLILYILRAQVVPHFSFRPASRKFNSFLRKRSYLLVNSIYPTFRSNKISSSENSPRLEPRARSRAANIRSTSPFIGFTDPRVKIDTDRRFFRRCVSNCTVRKPALKFH